MVNDVLDFTMPHPEHPMLRHAFILAAFTFLALTLAAADTPGVGPGWKSLGKDDFTKANCDDNTFQWKDDGSLYCTGTPVGVLKSAKQYTNFELVLEWKHLKPAGNSGVFVWAPEKPLAELKRGGLPHGIEVQVLDLAYKTNYEKNSKKKADWFTCHGDVFPVGTSKMKPFPPVSPNGQRSFPKKETTKAAGEWNHYHIKAVNGEIRLTVNGEEVSGGAECNPKTGYICLESEGSPIEFRNIKLKELP